MARARAAGVEQIVAIGTTADSSETCTELAVHCDGVYAAVGIQPNYCAQAAGGDWQRIVDYAGRPRVVAIGETGLDRFWDYTPFEIQQDFFGRHLKLSQQQDLPVIIHMRDCGPEIAEMLEEN